jgi:hypothetical protein
MRDTIDMAIEAGFDSSGTELTWESVICTEELKVFEALVRADEREIAIERAFVAMLGASHELTLRVVRAIRAGKT